MPIFSGCQRFSGTDCLRQHPNPGAHDVQPITQIASIDFQKKGMTILLADQNLKFCRRVCERGYIIEKGRIVHADTMEAIWDDEEVIQKYLVI